MADAQTEKNKLLRFQELEDIKNLLERPEGIRFFRRLMREGRLFTTTFTGNSNSFFLEGHRNLALKIFADIVEADPSKIPLIVMEDKHD